MADNRVDARRLLIKLTAGGFAFAVILLFTRIGIAWRCPILALTGIPCPGCGMTRAFAAILNMDFCAALFYNAAAIPLFLGICICYAAALWDTLFGTRALQRLRRVSTYPWFVPACVVYAALCWAYSIYRYIDI